MRGHVVEVLHVHRQRQGLQLGGHLLDPEAFAELDFDAADGGRIEQRGHQLVRGHVAAQDVVAGVELGGDLAVHGDEHERAGIGHEPLRLEAVGDR